jgi:CRP/FNR family transcriptional regulator, cyclic AMP receptor protein
MPAAAPPHELALLAQAVGAEGADLLHPHLEAIELRDGDTVFVDGAPSDHLVLLVSGELVVQHVADGRVVEMGRRGPGSWLGEVSLIDPGPATATVVCRGPVRLLQLEHRTLLDLTTDRPEVASVLLRHVTRQLADRVAASSSGIVERVGPGQVRLRKPEEVRGWVSTVLGWLVGGSET